MRDHQAPLIGSIVLITGASRGIGRAIATRLARAGAKTVLAARTIDALAVAAEEIRSCGQETLVVPTDVTDDQQLEMLVAAAQARFGSIDILVNNAGGGPPRTPIHKARLTDWDWTLRVNLWATMKLTQLVLPSMLERRSGAVINICSHAGLHGKAGEAAYAAAKFGVRGFTQALFEEVREHGVKVSAIFPGYVDTALIPPNRRVDREKMLRPEDVAEVVYEVATSSGRCCPLELVLHPQHDPFVQNRKPKEENRL
jgi:3-oxoacyl-[acyl-carrier protein] reductase